MIAFNSQSRPLCYLRPTQLHEVLLEAARVHNGIPHAALGDSSGKLLLGTDMVLSCHQEITPERASEKTRLLKGNKTTRETCTVRTFKAAMKDERAIFQHGDWVSTITRRTRYYPARCVDFSCKSYHVSAPKADSSACVRIRPICDFKQDIALAVRRAASPNESFVKKSIANQGQPSKQSLQAVQLLLDLTKRCFYCHRCL
eukprot:GHVP01056365.1.p1 GENE.GHVP01056365.1~~GHVP01056365.1.p1  ORF type:complete len:201 (+),score=4.37 GHVP01056365.1:331-933(+)